MRNAKQLPAVPVFQVSGGEDHTLERKNDGLVWAWGFNNARQLGIAPSLNVRVASEAVAGLPAIDGMTATYEIAVGGEHSMAKLADGRLWIWETTA